MAHGEADHFDVRALRDSCAVEDQRRVRANHRSREKVAVLVLYECFSLTNNVLTVV